MGGGGDFPPPVSESGAGRCERPVFLNACLSAPRIVAVNMVDSFASVTVHVPQAGELKIWQVHGRHERCMHVERMPSSGEHVLTGVSLVAGRADLRVTLEVSLPPIQV